MKIDYMKEYVTLVKNCNFSQTAEKLFISQSTLSRHLAIIEEEIGAQLFIRTTHFVQVTPIGQMVFDEFQIILNHYYAILEKASMDSKEFVGELEIGVMYYAMDEYMSPVLSLFKNKHPKIHLILDSLQPYEIIEKLDSQKIDMGLVIFTDNFNPEQYHFEQIRREKLVIVFPDNHHWPDDETISCAELSENQLVLCRTEKYYNQYLRKLLSKCNIDFDESVKTDQIDTLKSTLQDINGYSILPTHMELYYRDGFKIAEIEDKKSFFYIDIGFMYKRNNENPAISLFMKEIYDHFGKE